MSYDLFLNDEEQLAGPSWAATPFSQLSDPPSYIKDISSHSLLHARPERHLSHIIQQDPVCPNDTLIDTSRYPILPHHCFPACDNDIVELTYTHDDESCPNTSASHHSLRSTAHTSGIGTSGIDEVDTSSSNVQVSLSKNEDSNLHCDPRLTWSLFHVQQEEQPFYQLSPPHAHQRAAESFECPQATTPKQEVDSTTPPHILTPYAPMPLPPIFQLEPQPKIIQNISTALIPPACTLLWHEEEVKILPIDPVLLPEPPSTKNEVVPDAGYMPLTRGSTVSECLWPPSESPPPDQHEDCTYDATGVPLEIARQHARNNRLVDPHGQLSLPFLLSLMGQVDGQPPWSCYIKDCGKQLIRKSHMVDHIRMHLDERVYVCEHCPQTFLRKADCKRHSAAHNPEKAYQCNLCIKSFGRKDLLTRHKRKCVQNYGTGEGIRHIKEQPRRRKGIQGKSVFNTHDNQNVVFSAGNILPMLSEDFTKRDDLVLDDDGDNKENIPPYLFPGGLMFKFCGQ